MTNVFRSRFAVIRMALASVAVLVSGSASQAAFALVVNGASNSSEPATTGNITSNLAALLASAGQTPTIADTLPASPPPLTGYNSIWDIRFSNGSPLTSTDISRYVSYLSAGGSLFVMGENSGFTTRNNSVLALIAAAGGGALTFTTPGDSQSVLSPLTTPNPVSAIQYAAAGGVTTAGTGQFITQNSVATGGTAVLFAAGSLSAAPAGRLTVIFDVNFMQVGESQAGTPGGNFLRNLVGLQSSPVVPVAVVPLPPTMLLGVAGFAVAGLARLRGRRAAGTPA